MKQIYETGMPQYKDQEQSSIPLEPHGVPLLVDQLLLIFIVQDGSKGGIEAGRRCNGREERGIHIGRGARMVADTFDVSYRYSQA